MNLTNSKKVLGLVFIAILAFSLMPTTVKASRKQGTYDDSTLGYSLTAVYDYVNYTVETVGDSVNTNVYNKEYKQLENFTIFYSDSVKTAHHVLLNYDGMFTDLNYHIVDTFLQPLTIGMIDFLLLNNISNENELRAFNGEPLLVESSNGLGLDESTVDNSYELINESFGIESARSNFKFENIDGEEDFLDDYNYEYDQNYLSDNIKTQYRNYAEELKEDLLLDEDVIAEQSATQFFEAYEEDLEESFENNNLKILASRESTSTNNIELNDYNLTEFYEIPTFSEEFAEDIQEAIVDYYGASISDLWGKYNPFAGSATSDESWYDRLKGGVAGAVGDLNPFGDIIEQIQATINKLKMTFSNMAIGLTNIIDRVKTAFSNIKDKIYSSISNIKDMFFNHLNNTANAFKNVFKFVSGGIGKVLSVISGVLTKGLPIVLIIVVVGVVLFFGGKFYFGYRAKKAVATRV